MVTIWGLRLTIYLSLRNIGHGEDKRYEAFRRQAGAKYWWYSFFSVFLLQGVIQWLLSGLVLVGLASGGAPGKWHPLDAVGVAVWCIGLFFETVGDYQMSEFKKTTKPGSVMNNGLWKYSRHPNYFGDAAAWWGMWLVVATTGVQGIIAVYAPMIMNLLLMFVSGVPILEKQLTREKSGYSDYVAKTPAFFPWFPKRIQKKLE